MFLIFFQGTFFLWKFGDLIGIQRKTFKSIFDSFMEMLIRPYHFNPSVYIFL